MTVAEDQLRNLCAVLIFRRRAGGIAVTGRAVSAGYGQMIDAGSWLVQDGMSLPCVAAKPPRWPVALLEGRSLLAQGTAAMRRRCSKFPAVKQAATLCRVERPPARLISRLSRLRRFRMRCNPVLRSPGHRAIRPAFEQFAYWDR